MPILIGAAAACLVESYPTQRPADHAARKFLHALRKGQPGSQRDAAQTRFVDWAVGWLAARGVASPCFFALPRERGEAASGATGPGALLAAALAERIGRPAAWAGLRWNAGSAPLDPGAEPEALKRRLVLDGAPPSGEPVIVGDTFDDETLLRACALALSDAGVKPMFGLFAAREVRSPPIDPLAPEDLSFSVRP